jgi:hypothetical protein
MTNKTNKTDGKTSQERVALNDFNKIWSEHINELGRLKFYLNQEDAATINDIQSKLYGLVNKATRMLKAMREDN